MPWEPECDSFVRTAGALSALPVSTDDASGSTAAYSARVALVLGVPGSAPSPLIAAVFCERVGGSRLGHLWSVGLANAGSRGGWSAGRGRRAAPRLRCPARRGRRYARLRGRTAG